MKRRRRAILTVLIASFVVLTGGCRPQLGVELSVTPSKTDYAQGERVELTLRLTNHGPTPVGLSDFVDANFSLVSLTREGDTVASRTTTMVYDDDLEAMLRQSLTQVDVGGSVTMTWSSWPDDVQNGSQTLATVEFQPNGNHRATFHHVGEAGTYDLVVRYRFAAPVPPGSTTFEGTVEAAVRFRVAP